MNISEKQLQDLSLLMKKTGDEIIDENSSQFSQILENLGLLSEFASTGPVPLEAHDALGRTAHSLTGTDRSW